MIVKINNFKELVNSASNYECLIRGYEALAMGVSQDMTDITRHVEGFTRCNIRKTFDAIMKEDGYDYGNIDVYLSTIISMCQQICPIGLDVLRTLRRLYLCENITQEYLDDIEDTLRSHMETRETYRRRCELFNGKYSDSSFYQYGDDDYICSNWVCDNLRDALYEALGRHIALVRRACSVSCETEEDFNKLEEIITKEAQCIYDMLYNSFIGFMVTQKSVMNSSEVQESFITQCNSELTKCNELFLDNARIYNDIKHRDVILHPSTHPDTSSRRRTRTFDDYYMHDELYKNC